MARSFLSFLLSLLLLSPLLAVNVNAQAAINSVYVTGTANDSVTVNLGVQPQPNAPILTCSANGATNSNITFYNATITGQGMSSLGSFTSSGTEFGYLTSATSSMSYEGTTTVANINNTAADSFTMSYTSTGNLSSDGTTQTYSLYGKIVSGTGRFAGASGAGFIKGTNTYSPQSTRTVLRSSSSTSEGAFAIILP